MIAAARSHVRSLWPRGALWPILPWVVYAAYSLARGDFRADPLLVVVLVSALAYAGRRSKEIFLGLYPVGLVFILYDGMRPFQKVGLSESRVHACDLRGLESSLFGWNSEAGPQTLHDYFQAHHTSALDLFCAIPYATFILWCVAGGVYLYVKNRPAMQRFMWAFLLMNMAGFVTYHVLPAAPPWYIHAHGCTIDLATKASEGPALARVDALLGIHYFHGMYGKASSVFGALPSLHCAYPFLLVVSGWATFGWRLRVAVITYTLWMIFSAIYLDHHWLLDALLGLTYATLSFFAVRYAFRRFRVQRVQRPAPAVSLVPLEPKPDPAE